MPLPTDTLRIMANETFGTTVGAILERGTPMVYVVPRHQRAYSWKNNHISRYLKDIGFAKNERFPHNFGSIDLRDVGHLLDEDSGSSVEIHHGGKEETEYPLNEVNDGQQRLTTILFVDL